MFSRVRYLFNYHSKYNFLFEKELKKVLLFKNLDNKDLLEIQNVQFLKLFKNAIKHSKFYKELYENYGITDKSISSISDIKNLPVISKQDIRNRIDDIYIGNFLKVNGYTSGTSGSPLKISRSYHAVLKEAAYIWAHRGQFGYKPGMKTVSLRGDLGRSRMESYDKYSKTLFLSSYNLREENAEWYYEKIREFAPCAILAYPSSVTILANLISNMGRQLEVPHVFTSSETLYNNQREIVEQIFNTKIYDWYGNAERTIAIEQRRDGKYYELPTYSYNEFYDNFTICTGLLDEDFPLIRYKVTDVIKPSAYTSDYSDNRFEIAEISGRNDDTLILPDGTKVGRLDFVFKNIEHVEYAQFVQESSDKFKLNIVVSDKFSEKDKANIVNNLEYRIGSSMKYDIQKVQRKDLKVSKSGKFKLVVSEN